MKQTIPFSYYVITPYGIIHPYKYAFIKLMAALTGKHPPILDTLQIHNQSQFLHPPKYFQTGKNYIGNP